MNTKRNINFTTDIQELVPEYIENRLAELKTLLEDFKKGNYPNIEAIANRLKGSAGSYGFEQLGKIAEELETAASQKNHRQTNESLKKLNDYLKQHQNDK